MSIDENLTPSEKVEKAVNRLLDAMRRNKDQFNVLNMPVDVNAMSHEITNIFGREQGTLRQSPCHMKLSAI